MFFRAATVSPDVARRLFAGADFRGSDAHLVDRVDLSDEAAALPADPEYPVFAVYSYLTKKGVDGHRETGKKEIYCTSYSFLQSRVLVAPSGNMPRITGIYFLTQCSPCSHCQRSVHCAPSFPYYSRPRCFAAA